MGDNNIVKYDRKTAKDMIIDLVGSEEDNINYKIGSIIYNIDTIDVSFEKEVEELKTKNAELEKQIKSVELRLENAMTMFKSAKGVINTKNIVIEFLMERLGIQG